MIEAIKNNSGIRNTLKGFADDTREDIFQEVSFTFLRLLGRERPFIGQEVVLQRENPFPRLFFQNPVLCFEELSLNASLFQAAKLFGNECFNITYPARERKVVSRHTFVGSEKQKSPQDLTMIFKIALNSLRDETVTRYLISKPCFKDLYPDYLSATGLLVENQFSKNPTLDLDVIMSAEVFVRLSIMFSDRLGLLYYTQMVRSPLYQEIYKVIEKANDVTIDFLDTYDIYKKAPQLEEGALTIVRAIDDSIIRNDANTFSSGHHNGSAVGGNLKTPIGRRLKNNSMFLMNFSYQQFSETISSHERVVNGQKFIVEYKTAISLPNKYHQISEKVRPFKNQIVQEICKLKNESLSFRQKHTQNSGQLQVRNYWRTAAGDAKIFKSNELHTDLQNLFHVFLLIDNSCSISEAKIKVMETVITLVLNVIREHNDIFPYMSAYRQNGTNKKVFLTKLFDGKTSDHNVKQFGKVLYFKAEHVNYDPYALWELLFTHKSNITHQNLTNIVMLFGDAWPVSLNKDARMEAKEIMDTIRSTHPDLLIIYFATNNMYKAEELGYDFHINVHSDEFTLMGVVQQFQEVIKKILKRYDAT